MRHEGIGGVGAFLTSALDGGEWFSCPTHLTPGKERQYKINSRLDGPRAAVDILEKR